MQKVLFIKPFQVDRGDTEYIIYVFKERFPSSKCALLANVYKDDYEKLSKNPNIDQKFLYCPGIKTLGGVELLKLVFKFRKERFNLAVALSADHLHSSYQGYKKARLLAAFSGAKKSIVHFTKNGPSLLLSSIAKGSNIGIAKTVIVQRLDIIRYLFLSIIRTIFLFGIAGLFLIFIVTGIKIRRISFRLKRALFKDE